MNIAKGTDRRIECGSLRATAELCFRKKWGYRSHSLLRARKRTRCTENSATNAWNLNLNDGNLNNWNTKVSNSNYVRAVSAFLMSATNTKIHLHTSHDSV